MSHAPPLAQDLSSDTTPSSFPLRCGNLTVSPQRLLGAPQKYCLSSAHMALDASASYTKPQWKEVVVELPGVLPKAFSKDTF